MAPRARRRRASPIPARAVRGPRRTARASPERRGRDRTAGPEGIEFSRSVHVFAAAEVVAGHLADLHAQQEIARAVISAHVTERLEQLAFEQHRMAGGAEVGGADR